MIKDIVKSKLNIINTIKLLIYKENPSLFEKVDFDDDDVFLNPLLFAYFNSKIYNLFSSEILIEIMQGYFIKKEEITIDYSFNKDGIAYIPEVGYFKKGENTPFDHIMKIRNTNIEVLKYPISLFQNIFVSTSGSLINETEIIIDEELFEKKSTALFNAFQLIKENSEEQYKLIEQCCKKCIMFKTNPENTNSFASIKAHGVVFFNVYQDDYDEVFFVDDIAHQTGHVILTTLLFHDGKSIFKVDDGQNISEITKKEDHRNIYTLLHALYTYYTTFLCLDDCLKNNSFNQIQKNEAIGRIGFYLNKCSLDIENFEKIYAHFDGIDNVLTLGGIEIYTMIKIKYLGVFEKWYSVTKHFDYSNQSYNFSFKTFVELNNNLL